MRSNFSQANEKEKYKKNKNGTPSQATPRQDETSTHLVEKEKCMTINWLLDWEMKYQWSVRMFATQVYLCMRCALPCRICNMLSKSQHINSIRLNGIHMDSAVRVCVFLCELVMLTDWLMWVSLIKKDDIKVNVMVWFGRMTYRVASSFSYLYIRSDYLYRWTAFGCIFSPVAAAVASFCTRKHIRIEMIMKPKPITLIFLHRSVAASRAYVAIIPYLAHTRHGRRTQTTDFVVVVFATVAT